MNAAAPARYRFGDPARASLLLGLSLRQSIPLVIGVLWLTLSLMAGLAALGVVGPIVGLGLAFGRWRRAPLFDVAAPGLRLWWTRRRGRGPWVKASLLGAGPGFDDDVPPPLAGLGVLDVPVDWQAARRTAAVVHDQRSGSVSMVLQATGAGFPVASLASRTDWSPVGEPLSAHWPEHSVR